MASDSHSDAGVPEPGEVLLGKYRVERILGRGGMGVVVAATNIQLEDRVAIKLMLPSAQTDITLIKRFLREARTATRIRSEHVARVFDVGTLPSGSPYMVMEYLHGNDLAYLLEKGGPLEPAQAVDFLLQACEAIAEAHMMDVVHRDLKPANLFVIRRPDGTRAVKVLDFGISKAPVGADQVGMTVAQQVLGTPRYMSPEQLISTRDTDARSDVWALGAILHELIVGKPAFNGATLPDLCAQILQVPAARLRTLRPDAPQRLEDAIAQCLQQDVARRFQNVGQFAQAIAPCGTSDAARSVERIIQVLKAAGIAPTPPPLVAPGVPVTSTKSPAALVESSAEHPPVAAATAGSATVKPRRIGKVVAAVAAVLVLAGVAILSVAARQKTSSVPANAAGPAQLTPTVASPSSAVTGDPSVDSPAPTISASPTASSAAPTPSRAPLQPMLAPKPKPRGVPTGAPPATPPPKGDSDPFGNLRQ